jgi:hypothetical protein
MKCALNSSIFACTLADKNLARQIPDYPKRPHIDEISQQEVMTEEQLKAERLRTYCFFKTLGKR